MFSGLASVESDRDSVNKKEEYESQYNKTEAALIRQQEAEQEELKKLRAMQSRVRENSQRQTSVSNAFVAPVSDSEIARLQRKRRNQTWEEMNRNLAGLASPDEMEDEQDKPVHYRLSDTNRVSERRETTEGGSLKSGQSPTSPDSETPEKVTKKTTVCCWLTILLPAQE